MFRGRGRPLRGKVRTILRAKQGLELEGDQRQRPRVAVPLQPVWMVVPTGTLSRLEEISMTYALAADLSEGAANLAMTALGGFSEGVGDYLDRHALSFPALLPARGHHRAGGQPRSRLGRGARRQRKMGAIPFDLSFVLIYFDLDTLNNIAVSMTKAVRDVITRMLALYPPPMHLRQDGEAREAALESYAKVLERFDRATLERAWEKVVAENKYWVWPQPGLIVEACELFAPRRLEKSPEAEHRRKAGDGRRLHGQVHAYLAPGPGCQEGGLVALAARLCPRPPPGCRHN